MRGRDDLSRVRRWICTIDCRGRGDGGWGGSQGGGGDCRRVRGGMREGGRGRGRGRRAAAHWAGGLRDPHAVGFCGDELGNGVGECAAWCDVEDGKGVFTLVHAASGENNGDKVDAGIAEERERGGFREEFHVGDADIADDVLGIVEDGQGRDAFVVEELEGGREGLVATGIR